jgi:hypothetical protein
MDATEEALTIVRVRAWLRSGRAREQVAVLREDINTRMIPRSGPRPVG